MGLTKNFSSRVAACLKWWLIPGVGQFQDLWYGIFYSCSLYNYGRKSILYTSLLAVEYSCAASILYMSLLAVEYSCAASVLYMFLIRYEDDHHEHC